MTRVYAQNRKQLFQLADKVGEGGEGTVFAWPSDPLRVCKVYHDTVLQERGDTLTRKLAAMLAAPPDDPMRARGNPTFAWPEELVFDPTNHKRLVGFVMPRIRESHSLHKLYSAGDRKQLSFPHDREGRPLPEYYVMVATARNLAEAFRLLHAQGYVMADVNEDNIRFRTDATVSLIDNDSFQVRDRSSGEKFLVPVLKAEYWPVDSLELHERGEALAPSHDQFCLAVFLFRLLMNGVHPFHGMSPAGTETPSFVENIASGHFPFLPAHSGGQRPPYHAPAFESLPAEVRALFRRCFVEGVRQPSARADAGTWVKALDRAHKTLKRCRRGHMHFAEARQCPWCELEDARVSCPKGHRYYRAEGSCPQCRLEQRRAARSSGTPSQVTRAVSVPIPSRPAVPVLSRPAPQPRVVTSPSPTLPQLKISGNTAVNPQDGAELVLIPAGSFLMGDNDMSDNPRHTVKLSGYWIYKNVVTVGQYKKYVAAIMAAGKNVKMPVAPDFNKNWSQDNHPIVNVSWEDAKAYCDWAGVRLPTEAEWEKASRGTEGRKYPWGNKFDNSKLWCSVQELRSGTAPVGAFKDGASPYGALDMAGNVWQWCSDWYDGNYWKSDHGADPIGPSVGVSRVLRGGSWDDNRLNNQVNFRSAYRLSNRPTNRDGDCGFRCASGL